MPSILPARELKLRWSGYMDTPVRSLLGRRLGERRSPSRLKPDPLPTHVHSEASDTMDNPCKGFAWPNREGVSGRLFSRPSDGVRLGWQGGWRFDYVGPLPCM